MKYLKENISITVVDEISGGRGYIKDDNDMLVEAPKKEGTIMVVKKKYRKRKGKGARYHGLN